MIHISNLRKESAGDWTRLVADFTYEGGGKLLSDESSMWFAVKNENAGMLTDDVYNAFLLVPLYLGMYYKQDLYIHGCVSKRLYKNVMNYLQRILCDFSDDLSRIDVHVDGFKEAEGEQYIIGGGISCGVDSLTTIYDRYVNESDPEYKINSLFLFNCGTHGDYGEESEKLYQERYNLNKNAADELGLPVVQVESNLHAFTHKVGPDPKAGYFAIWSCIFALERVIKKYYIASAYGYNHVITHGKQYKNVSFAVFAETYSVPLLSTERLEFILDGSQYERSGKTEHISDWDIARRYLNVCTNPVNVAHNCSRCNKCLSTITNLEVIGKLENFAGVFDLDTYKKVAFKNKCIVVVKRTQDAMREDNYNFAKSHGMKLPSPFTARLYLFALSPHKLRRFSWAVKRSVRKIMGDSLCDGIKKFVKR